VISWFWDFGDGGISTEQNPIHAFADTGWYQVMLVVTNEYGCTDTIIKPFYSYPPFAIYIPNAFTPNLDGINDVFTAAGQGFTSIEMSIFDRWGREIFRTNDTKRGWTGYDENNRKYPIGVYVYRIDALTPPGFKYRYIGRVTLIR
jgi:gliding motility-associated-like protein